MVSTEVSTELVLGLYRVSSKLVLSNRQMQKLRMGCSSWVRVRGRVRVRVSNRPP